MVRLSLGDSQTGKKREGFMKVWIIVCATMLSFNLGATTNVSEAFIESRQVPGEAVYRQVGKFVNKLKNALRNERLYRKTEFRRLERFIKNGNIDLALRVLANYESRGGRQVLKAVKVLRRNLNKLTGQNTSEVRETCPRSGLQQTEFFSTERAFAALKPNGMVITWGSPSFGGNSTEIVDELSCGVVKVFSTQSAFAALKADGSVVTWGDPSAGGNSALVASQLTGSVKDIFSTERAFVAVKEDDSLVAWGDRLHGGEAAAIRTVYANDISSQEAFPLAASLLDGTKGRVLKIVSTTSAFAAIMQDKQDATKKFVIAWGDSLRGGDTRVYDRIDSNDRFFDRYRSYGSTGFYEELDLVREIGPLLENGVEDVFSTDGAFAALKSNGSVITWGAGLTTASDGFTPEYYGGSSHSVAYSINGGVVKIFSNSTAFAALKSNGSVITWGDENYGGDSSSVSTNLASGVVDIAANEEGFAAIKEDRSVVIWGNYNNQNFHSRTETPQNVVKIVASSRSFAALERGGSVTSWGDIFMQSFELGVLQSNVVDIVANDEAFAAIKSDGSVVTWGWEFAGGDATFLYNDYFAAENAAYERAYSAGQEPDPVQIQREASIHLHRIKSGVVKIASTRAAFVALKNDGTIVTWGDAGYGGDSTLVASLFSVTP